MSFLLRIAIFVFRDACINALFFGDESTTKARVLIYTALDHQSLRARAFLRCLDVFCVRPSPLPPPSALHLRPSHLIPSYPLSLSNKHQEPTNQTHSQATNKSLMEY